MEANLGFEDLFQWAVIGFQLSVFHTGIDTSGHNQIQRLVILSRSGHISFPLTLVSDRQPQAIVRYDALVC